MAELQTWEETVRQRKKRNIIIIAAVLAACLMLFLGTYKVLIYSETSDFCNKCHEMKPYHATWIQSSHHEVSCYQCHFSPAKKIEVKPTTVIKKEYWNFKLGTKTINVTPYMTWIKNKVVAFNTYVDKGKIQTAYAKDKMTFAGQLLSMMMGGRDNGAAITWKNCESCHSEGSSSKSDTDSAGHATHARIGLTCNNCHGDVTHMDVVKIERAVCTRCHASGPPKPESHQNAVQFQSSHGQMYLQENSCRICHPKGTKEKLCMDCHGVEIPHKEGYPQIHVQQIKEVGIKKCQNCHKEESGGSQGLNPASSVGSPEKGGTVWSKQYLEKMGKQAEDTTNKNEATSKAAKAKKNIACSKCHGKNLLHTPAQALAEHSQRALKSTTACYSCHKTDECTSCHGMTMPHPQTFFAQHGQMVKTSGSEKCSSCHNGGSGRAPVCYNCHKVVMPHPIEFITKHAEQDHSICDNCHSQKNPANPKGKAASKNFCQTCHGAPDHFEGHWERDRNECTKCHIENMGCTKCHAV